MASYDPRMIAEAEENLRELSDPIKGWAIYTHDMIERGDFMAAKKGIDIIKEAAPAMDKLMNAILEDQLQQEIVNLEMGDFDDPL